MYKETNQYAEAYRVAKSNGGEVAAKQIAFLWAKDLGGDAAVKLLQSYSLLDEAIELGIEQK
jgi:intraflagellar transport protein 172